MTKLNDALKQAADYLHLNADELVKFAKETPDFPNMPYGGFSIDREEGMFLYALTRALQPEHGLEIGMFQGVSSLHILAAMDANDTGGLTSVDLNDVHGDMVTMHRWTPKVADATTADLPDADFVYEDSNHTLPDAATILGKVKALNPRVVVSHDYYSDELYQDPKGFQVRQAFEQTFGTDVQGIRWDKGQRGFGLWLNPDWQAPEPAEKRAPASKPAPNKRAPAKKAAARK